MQVEISLTEANENLKKCGFDPFPIDAFVIDCTSDKHLDLSIESIEKALQNWQLKQIDKSLRKK